MPGRVRIDPFADRISHVGRIDLLGPVASVGKDSPLHVAAVDEDVGGVRQDDDLHRLKQCHDQRHAARAAGKAARGAGSAGGLIRQIGLEDGVIFPCQRGSLRLAPALGRIIRRLRRARRARKRGPVPFAIEVGILRILEGEGAGIGCAQRCRQRDGADRAPVEHDVLPDDTVNNSFPAPGCSWLSCCSCHPDDRQAITAPSGAPRTGSLTLHPPRTCDSTVGWVSAAPDALVPDAVQIIAATRGIDCSPGGAAPYACLHRPRLR